MKAIASEVTRSAAMMRSLVVVPFVIEDNDGPALGESREGLLGLELLAWLEPRGLERWSGTLAGTSIIAPGKWVERIAFPASSEPGFSEPWPPRRGWIESLAFFAIAAVLDCDVFV